MESATIPVDVLPWLPRRKFDSHKGSFGKVLIAAGGRGMSGAAILCGCGALRSGAGLVQVATPANVQAIVAAGNPCYTTFPIHQHADGTFSEQSATQVIDWAKSASALAIGPGLGHGADIAGFVKQVVGELPQIPTVIDADGLNSLSPFQDEFSKRSIPLILTPHPGEFCRLSGKSMAEIEAHRDDLAVDFAAKFSVVLLLKGAGTIVTDGRRLYRNTTGNPGMATGGSGDVLTGVIAALLGQRLSPFDAAVLGAWVHGRAGDLAARELGEIGMIAADLPGYLAQAFRELQRN
ncbi:MAG TPA: NAD(P)H-hydrate dehydratase [Urbifossiella sp.]|jgi:NAD(P)H-hydrate epimerase